MRRILAAFALCLLVAAPAGAGEREALLTESLDGLSGARALELVKELASDAMKGRKTAFEGGALVENWMLQKMADYGLHPADAGGTYLEPFTYGASDTRPPIALALGGKALRYGKDYFDLTYTGSGKVEAEAVFVGYGIARPDLGWDDYAGLDVKGKIVVAIRGAPAARAEELHEERFIGSKSSMAADKGAAGFLLVQDDKASTGTIQDRFHRPRLPALWISGAVADAHLFAQQKTTLAELKTSRDEGEPGKGFATGVRVALEVNATYEPRAKGHNALGAIKGRDPDLKDEVVVVGAHMDHLGVGPDGQVFHGADDNASGTAVMMHLADVLTANRFRPKRTIVFCGFGAEEQGLFGSRALAERYPFPGKVVCVLNMDMVGQGEPVVRIGGGGGYPRLQALMEELLPAEVKTLIDFGARTGPGSDHWPFHERGVPAFGIHTKGKHPNYHTPADQAANIDPQCLEAAARVVGSLVVMLASHPQPLADPQGIAPYLAREGPRFGFGVMHEGLPVMVDPAGSLGIGPEKKAGHPAGDVGLGALLCRVPAGKEGLASWQALSARCEGEDAGFLHVRKAADVGRAWRSGKLGLLPLGVCAGSPEERLAQIEGYAGAGFRIVSPFGELPEEEGLDEAMAKRLLEACAAHDVLADLGPLGPGRWARARRLLGERPAVAVLFTPKWERAAAGLGALGPRTLVLLAGSAGDGLAPALGASDAGPRIVLLDHLTHRVSAALADWGAPQPEGWDLPGSAQRRAVRAALGGHLVQWLARTERASR